jgi:oxygen-independent coproporphyrinogen-3 oxidase
LIWHKRHAAVANRGNQAQLRRINLSSWRPLQKAIHAMSHKMQKSDLFSARVPRYTSYPTAPHFHPGIDQAVYRQWLSDLPVETPLSLYLHIPFCDTLCWFCGCHTSVVNHYAPVKDYCGLLAMEMDQVAKALGAKRTVQHIHWGGGSPTMLQPGDIDHLARELRSRFAIAQDAEFAVEIDPRGLARDCVDAFARAGLTRASIGLQDIDPVVQKAINRIQTPEETAHAIAMLRQAGIKSINLDLLYGLPNQTLKTWEKTLRFALTLKPDRLAVFGYAHVPYFKKHQALIPERLLPDIETRLCQVEMASQILGANGYLAVGLDHFAKPEDSMARASGDGSLTRNFQGYTTDTASALIGLGASAIGSLPQGYVQNAAAVPTYRAALAQGRLPVARGIALSPEDRLRRYVIERLMCDLKVDLEEACTRFGGDPSLFSEARKKLAALEEAGAVSIEKHRISIQPQWRTGARLVCAAFDAYLADGPIRHSISV